MKRQRKLSCFFFNVCFRSSPKSLSTLLMTSMRSPLSGLSVGCDSPIIPNKNSYNCKTPHSVSLDLCCCHFNIRHNSLSKFASHGIRRYNTLNCPYVCRITYLHVQTGQQTNVWQSPIPKIKNTNLERITSVTTKASSRCFKNRRKGEPCV